jgi:hypothetical protein
MMSPPALQDIQSYLVEAGWERQSRIWNGASIWSNPGGYEVLVPSRDDMADTNIRVAEIISALTAAEGRPADEIAGDINTPFDDIQLYRTYPDGDSITLASELATLRSVQDLIGTAARTVISGPHSVFLGSAPRLAGEFLRQIRLAPNRSEGHIITVRIPLASMARSPGNAELSGAGDALPLGRQVGHQLRAAVIAARSAAARANEQNLSPFNASVAAGVSANLCEALSGLAGRQQRQPFEVSFRWGRGLPSPVPADAVHFADSAGTIFRAGAVYLRDVNRPPEISGIATITGLVQSLHGHAPDNGWQIRVHGDLLADGVLESDRTLRVSLDSRAEYDQAIIAHLAQQHVQARGDLVGSGRNIKLAVSDESFQIIEGNT